MKEAREQRRLHVMSYIKVCERDSNKSVGRVVDITTKGMRLCSDQPIEPESTYQFTMILPKVERGNERVSFDANVIWCKKDDIFDLYDAGVELINVADNDLQMIEDFIQYSTFEERWLSGVKTYPRDF